MKKSSVKAGGNPQGCRNLVAHNSCNESRQKHIIHDAPNKQNFDAENCACDGCAKNRGKSGADAADHQFLAVCFVKVQQVSDD